LALLMLAPQGGLLAQDIHFSQIHASPTVLNPALTGLFDGDYRVIANYRQQWRSASANYRTLAASADAHIMGLGQGGLLSGGIQVLADRAGDLDFTTSSALFTLGAARRLNSRGDHMISVAIQGGLLQQSLNFAAMQVFDPEPVVMSGASNRRIVPDASVGLAWYKGLGREHKIYAGYALFHLGTPDMSLLGSGGNYEEPLARRSVFHGGGEFRVNSQWHVLPSFIVMEQSPNREINLGSFVRCDYDQSRASENRSSLYLGTWFRWFYRPDIASGYDALVAAARWDKNRLSLAFSYDVNLSTLSRASRGAGGPELSVIYIGMLQGQKASQKRHKVDCPRF
jgi:type IX secretion system PorP/SprF family membrane protein